MNMEQLVEMSKNPKEIDAQELMTQMASMVDIPEKSGKKYCIKHEIIKKGEPVTVISMRNSIMMGYRPVTARFDTDLKIHKLCTKKDKRTLMSDHPQEIFLSKEGITLAMGKVLIGGLGLGYAIDKIADDPTVDKVDVVEIEKDIIDLVKPHLHFKKINVIHADIFKYLATTKKKYNYIFLDTWYRSNENEYWENVFPLRRLAAKLVEPLDIFCWMETEMLAQVKSNLYHILMGAMKPWNLMLNAVYMAIMARGICSDDIGNPKEAIEKFFKNIGTKEWEDEWKFQYHLDTAKKRKKYVKDTFSSRRSK